MTIAYFLEIKTSQKRGEALRTEYRDNVIPTLLTTDGVESVHLYRPDHRERPFNNDKNPPEMVLQIDVANLEVLSAVFTSVHASKLFIVPAGCVATHDVFETRNYPFTGNTEPPPRRAPFTFAVRYHRPLADETAFVDHYLANHPQILVQMPKVRNVLCYVPVAWNDPTDIPRSGCIVGNEVVFDKFEDLVAMQSSKEIEQVRADSIANPARSGPSTHFAFHREDFVPQGSV